MFVSVSKQSAVSLAVRITSELDTDVTYPKMALVNGERHASVGYRFTCDLNIQVSHIFYLKHRTLNLYQ